MVMNITSKIILDAHKMTKLIFCHYLLYYFSLFSKKNENNINNNI